MKYFWMGLGGAAGTLLRYGLTSATMNLFPTKFPLGTFFVNITGSLVIGLLWGMNGSHPFSQSLAGFLFIGLLGGYTTFSAFSLENLQMLRQGEIAQALTYVILSCTGGLLAAYLGLRWSGSWS